VELRKLEKDKKITRTEQQGALQLVRPTPYGGLNVSLTYLCNLRRIAIAISIIKFA